MRLPAQLAASAHQPGWCMKIKCQEKVAWEILIPSNGQSRGMSISLIWCVFFSSEAGHLGSAPDGLFLACNRVNKYHSLLVRPGPSRWLSPGTALSTPLQLYHVPVIRLSALYSNNPLQYFENLYYSQQTGAHMTVWMDGQPKSGDSSNINNSSRVSSLGKDCSRQKKKMSSRKLKKHVPGGCCCSSSAYVCSRGPCNWAVGAIDHS